MMQTGQPEHESWTPSAEADREAVRRQLEKVLRHPLFAHSQRYPALLRYVVEQAVVGTVDHIKERTIGVLVFGRNPSYDANSDPVVRVTAGQIRKRLTQYYTEPGHRNEIRIVLPTGSYVPQLFPPNVESGSDDEVQDNEENQAAAEPDKQEADAVMLRQSGRRGVEWRAFLLGAFVGIVVVLVGVSVFHRSSTDDIRNFWRPLLDAPGPIVLCLRPQPNSLPTAQGALGSAVQAGFTGDQIHLALRISEAFPEFGGRLRFQSEDSATFETFRSAPVILIASGPDQWSERLGPELRYTLEQQGDAVSVVDRSKSTQARWTDSHAGREADGERAYAIVARFFDATLAEPVVLVSGTSPAGTAAGVELITSQRGMDAVRSQAPPGWQKGNLEVVVEAGVVNGYAGAPHMLAAHFW